jgi:hypothetical protein
MKAGIKNMPYEIPLNVVEILKSTLYLLEHTIYPGKDGTTVSELKKCISDAIRALTLEAQPMTADPGHAMGD